MVVEACKTIHHRIINTAGLLVTELYTMQTYFLTVCNSVNLIYVIYTYPNEYYDDFLLLQHYKSFLHLLKQHMLNVFFFIIHIIYNNYYSTSVLI